MFGCSVPELSKTALTTMADAFHALSSPLRLSVLLRLLDGPARVTDLSTAVNASQPLVSQHLTILRSSGLVRAQRNGRSVIYALNDDSPIPEMLTALVRRYTDPG
jgi:ArsR family transcriptional regulator, zinc-responsive transcriptional repressor